MAGNEIAIEPSHGTDSQIIHGFKFTPTGIVPIGEPSLKEWSSAYLKIKSFAHSVHWLVGDMLNYGQEHYGEEFSQVLDEFDPGTIRNDKWICSRIPYDERVENLSFEHHKIVAQLDKPIRQKFLAIADKEMITTRRLRELVLEGTEEGDIRKKRAEGIKKSLAQAYVFIDLLRDAGSIPLDLLPLSKKVQDNLYSGIGDQADEIIASFR